jgi:hypothetical protein
MISRSHSTGTPASSSRAGPRRPRSSAARRRGIETRGHIEGIGEIRISVEPDPLEALKLGTYVGTCLGRGGNLESAAAAVVLDVNKQVVYARDRRGAVVGRQLLAISEADDLVCFAVYGTARIDLLMLRPRSLDMWSLEAPGCSAGPARASRPRPGPRAPCLADMALHDSDEHECGDSADLYDRSARRSAATVGCRVTRGVLASSRAQQTPARAITGRSRRRPQPGVAGSRRRASHLADGGTLVGGRRWGLSHGTRPGDPPEVAWNRHRPRRCGSCVATGRVGVRIPAGDGPGRIRAVGRCSYIRAKVPEPLQEFRGRCRD